ncbi:MAG TPA: hypothetical protein ENG33_09185 [Chloroflexi bacterium]|nr:hypothetical protein [Chloroflexota bacterium]
MKAKAIRFLALSLIILLLAGCRASGISDAVPPRPVEVSPELADQAWDKLKSIEAKGEFSLTLTEGEVTSLLVSSLEEKVRENPLQKPSIWFENGRVIITGKIVNVVPLTLDFLVVFSPYVEEGLPQLKFNRLWINGWDVPGFMLKFLSRSANDTIAEIKLKAEVTEITVEQGSISIKGYFSD